MEEILAPHLPYPALEYCVHLSEKYNFQLDFSFNRKTKFGHYKYLPKSKEHIISINRGLSKPLFLITYLHELAHLEVMLKHGRRVQPHGNEWKNTFAEFLQPVLTPSVFEPDLLKALKKHSLNPKASLIADPGLWKILFSDDTSLKTLDEVADGQFFVYKNRTFKKLKTRRTRVLCYEPASRQRYLIPRLTPIEPAG